MKKKIIISLSILIICVMFIQFVSKSQVDENYVSCIVNPKVNEVNFFWRNEKKINFGSIENLKNWLVKNNKKLLFAMNGGMYKKDKSAQGLFIQNNIIKSQIDTTSGNGNFYLKPNGVFYLNNDNEAFVSKTENFKFDTNVRDATQSGPMLLIDGEIHKIFNKNSTNLNIRNGVGVLPNNEILFAMSKKDVNFYEFATFFKSKGCKNALYLDGFVSRTYYPEQNWIQTDGDFGVIIGVSKKIK